MGESDLLVLLSGLSTLLQEETTLFASPEDAEYFRTWMKSRGHRLAKKVEPSPPPIFSPPPLKEQKEIEPLEKIAPLAAAVPPPTPLPALPPPLPKEQKEIEPVAKVDPPAKTAPLAAPAPPPTPPPALPSPPGVATPKLLRIETAPSFHLGALKSLFGKIAPNIPILDLIPSDTEAKKIAERWKTKNQAAPLSILYYTEPPEQKILLEEITKALDVYFGPARLIAAESIEKEKQWEVFLLAPNLKMIFACDYTLWQLKNLTSHYKEKDRLLGNVPLFLLPDMSLYLKDPLLKRSLWKALCAKLCS